MAKVKEITYYEERNLLGPNKWKCYVITDDGERHVGVGLTKEDAKENALEIMNANN